MDCEALESPSSKHLPVHKHNGGALRWPECITYWLDKNKYPYQIFSAHPLVFWICHFWCHGTRHDHEPSIAVLKLIGASYLIDQQNILLYITIVVVVRITIKQLCLCLRPSSGSNKKTFWLLLITTFQAMPSMTRWSSSRLSLTHKVDLH